jgi:toxin-antitoxin system PIN domain toxin
MKSCLADVNVLVALLAGHHPHHLLARNWFAACREGEIGVCRYAQLAVIRLLGNPALMGDSAISGFAAYRVIQDLLDLDERVEFVQESPNLDSFLPQMLSHPAPASKAVNDVYLAAFAIASSRRLVTFDAGFRRFKDLDLLLLQPRQITVSEAAI